MTPAAPLPCPICRQPLKTRGLFSECVSLVAKCDMGGVEMRTAAWKRLSSRLRRLASPPLPETVVAVLRDMERGVVGGRAWSAWVAAGRPGLPESEGKR